MKQLSRPTGEDFFYINKIKTLHSTYLLFAYLVDGQRVELAVPFSEEKERYPASHIYNIHLRDVIHPSFPFVTCSKDQNNQSASTCSNIYMWWTNATMKPD